MTARIPQLKGPGGRKIRIAHLTTVGLSQAKLLATELKVDVSSGLVVYAICAPDEYIGEVEKLGVQHVPIKNLTRSWDPRRDVAATTELLRALHALDLDVLHTHNPKTGVIGRFAGRSLGVPVVVNTCHGLWAQQSDSLARRSFVYISEVAAGQVSDAELYQNDEDRQTLKSWIPQHRARVAGNGTDLETYCPDPVARKNVRTEWGIADNEMIVGGVGRLVAEKGLREFNETALALADRAHFVWVGPGDPDKADAVSLDSGDVRYIGVRDDMAAVYNALDIFVLPSYREGFSRSAMEAAATGLPMVLSDIRGCREIGRHQDELLLVPVRNANALTNAVSLLLDDRPLATRLGDAARHRALKEFDQVAIAALSIDTYWAVAERKGLNWSRQLRTPEEPLRP